MDSMEVWEIAEDGRKLKWMGGKNRTNNESETIFEYW